jgi:hypothetical protein
VEKGRGDYGVATFQSTHSVLKAEKTLKDAGLAAVRLVPVPSQVSSDCGVTVRFLLSDRGRAMDLLRGLSADLEGFFAQTADGWEPLSMEDS